MKEELSPVIAFPRRKLDHHLVSRGAFLNGYHVHLKIMITPARYRCAAVGTSLLFSLHFREISQFPG